MAHVRAFKEADADAVAAIMNESIEARDSTMRMDRLSRASVLAEVAAYSTQECMLVVEDDGQVAGWGRIRRYSAAASWLRRCWICPRVRLCERIGTR